MAGSPRTPRSLEGSASDALKYADTGVDIDAGDAFARAIAPMAASTTRPGADTQLGGFGGVFDLAAAGWKDPLLVAGADGVGTKLDIAAAMGRYDTVGVDLVAMCVNDILAQGAEPLFFLDYIAMSRLDPAAATQLVEGVALGCRQAGCALIGGETAELPGFYPPGKFDAAGFAVGAVERGDLLPQLGEMRAGDALIGLASSGAHANGFSFIRAVLARLGLALEGPTPWEADRPLGETLLTPTRLYVSSVLPLARAGRLKGAAHITGGGLVDNPPRATPADLAPVMDWASWEPPAVFQWLQEASGADDAEMRRTFNNGVGMMLIVDRDSADDVVADLRAAGETAWICGALEAAA